MNRTDWVAYILITLLAFAASYDHRDLEGRVEALEARVGAQEAK